MTKDEIRKLIGGYASGTLTAAEQQQLFEAALDDQELFDELQQEQPLKELLSDPVSREELRRAATDSLPKRGLAWFRRPWILALGASVAAASITIAFLGPWHGPVPAAVTTQHQVETARAVAPALDAPEPVGPVNVPRRAPAPKTKAFRRESVQTDKKFVPPAVQASPMPAPAAKQTVPEKDKPAATEQQVEVTAAAPPPPVPAQQTAAPAVQPPAQNQAHQESAPAAQARATHPLAKSAQAFRARQTVGALAQISAPYSISRRLESGAYSVVPNDTVFHPDDSIRITIFPAEPGPISVEEWHAGDSAWHPIPASPPTFGSIGGAVSRYGVPLDITVKQGEKLRVRSGSGSYDIVIRTEP